MNELINLIAGLLLPPLISWLKDCRWPAHAKLALSLLLSLLAGGVSAYLDGALNWSDLVSSGAVVFTVATAFYKFWFEQTDLNQRLEDKQVL